MALVIEARHGVVGLRRKAGPHDAAFVERLKYRKAPAAHEPVHQRGDEDRLAGAREPGNAEPHRRRQQIAAVVRECERGEAGLFEPIG